VAGFFCGGLSVLGLAVGRPASLWLVLMAGLTPYYGIAFPEFAEFWEKRPQIPKRRVIRRFRRSLFLGLLGVNLPITVGRKPVFALLWGLSNAGKGCS
jgi:hypothetical protein